MGKIIRHSVMLMWILLWMIPGVSASTFNHSKFDQIVKEYVDDNGLVDYNSIAQDKRFTEYMQSLQRARVGEFSRDGQLAFWINAYNAVTIDKVIKKKPKKSVRETFVPGVWTSTKFFTSREHIVAGKRLSQDDIEHEILRKQFKDPRIHFAIICASMGCPPLPRIAYTEENVQARLEEETRKYLNSPRGTRIDRAENTLHVSKLFDWFGSDFINKSGSILAFMQPYLHEEVRIFLERDPMISYLEYNWALNAQAPLKD
ncbi:MAG: DUF547 domain-containing protein [Deltaproteobacteria bacterium]|nr:MAG: DUF547 domain-containing protein [Deltaproteobacteria bacterium]